MQPSLLLGYFESVIERKIHAWFNYMEGVMHTGQRNQFRIRVSNDAYDKGLRMKHFGEVLYYMIMDEFAMISPSKAAAKATGMGSSFTLMWMFRRERERLLVSL